MKYSFDDTPELGEKLNRLAREEMKLRLLRDIHTDITVCKLEGWDYHGYLDELQELIESIKARAGTRHEKEYLAACDLAELMLMEEER